jgi:hypothetical protein
VAARKQNRLFCFFMTDTQIIETHDDFPVELTVGPRLRALGGLTVNRVWPTARRRLVGPFIFFDHMQRAELAAGVGLDVPPHPHIGLATITYLFEGALMHRDSLGIEQLIKPGELNWMTAGRGIAHSERSPADERARLSYLHGIQSWVALPREDEEMAPSFVHYGAADVPVVDAAGAHLRVIAGSAFGAQSRVDTRSALFYVDAEISAGASLRLEPELGERAAYVVSGRVAVGAKEYDAGQVLVFRNGLDVELRAVPGCKLMLFGGDPLESERYIWWNFVSSSSARIEMAKRDWQARRFGSVPGESEYMPLPE